MKIEEYGIVFQPMFFPDEPPFAKVETCAKFILDNSPKDTESYKLAIKVLWNNKPTGWLQLNIVRDIVYIKMVKSRMIDRGGNSAFLEKLMSMLPEMQDHGILSVGILNI